MSDETAKTHSQKEVKWQDAFFYLLEKVRTLSNTYGKINENSEQARRKMFSFFFKWSLWMSS